MTHFLIWILGHLLPQEDSTVVGQHPIYIFVVVPPHCIVDERGKSFRRVDLCFKGPFLCLSGSTDVVLSVPDKLGQIGQQSSEDAFSLMKAKHFIYVSGQHKNAIENKLIGNGPETLKSKC